MNDKLRFSLGRRVWTSGATEIMSRKEARRYFARHESGDFGDLVKSDITANRLAILHGEARIVSEYDHNGTKILVITEADRSVTTILLKDEY